MKPSKKSLMFVLGLSLMFCPFTFAGKTIKTITKVSSDGKRKVKVVSIIEVDGNWTNIETAPIVPNSQQNQEGAGPSSSQSSNSVPAETLITISQELNTRLINVIVNYSDGREILVIYSPLGAPGRDGVEVTYSDSATNLFFSFFDKSDDSFETNYSLINSEFTQHNDKLVTKAEIDDELDSLDASQLDSLNFWMKILKNISEKDLSTFTLAQKRVLSKFINEQYFNEEVFMSSRTGSRFTATPSSATAKRLPGSNLSTPGLISNSANPSPLVPRTAEPCLGEGQSNHGVEVTQIMPRNLSSVFVVMNDEDEHKEGSRSIQTHQALQGPVMSPTEGVVEVSGTTAVISPERSPLASPSIQSGLDQLREITSPSSNFSDDDQAKGGICSKGRCSIQ